MNSEGKPRREPTLFPGQADIREDTDPFRESGLGRTTVESASRNGAEPPGLPEFLAKIRSSVILAWLLPPAFAIFLLQYQGFYSGSEMMLALRRFGFAYIAICTLAAALLLPRYAERIARSVTDADPNELIDWRKVRNRLRLFQLILLTALGAYCTLGPLIGNIVVGQSRGRPFSLEEGILAILATAPGIVMASLPILFRVSDHLGAFFAARGGVFVVSSLRTKVFALGMLPAIMVGAAMFVYFRDRTGSVSTEAVAATGVLILMAALATGIAWNSFRHSLAPLREPLVDLDAALAPGYAPHERAAHLLPNSLDEIGLLVHGWSRLSTRDKDLYEQIRYREELMGLVTNSLQGMVAYIDTEERFKFVNETYREWWRIDPEAMIGRSLSEFLAPDVYSKLTPRIAAALAGVETTDIARFEYPDGQTRICETRFLPHKAEDGTIHGIIALTLDITDRETAKETAQLAHTRLLDAVESLPVAFALYDQNEALVICNAIHRDLTPWRGELCVPGVRFEDLVRNTARSGIAGNVKKDDASATDQYITNRLKDFREATGKPIEIERSNENNMLSFFRRTSDGGTVSVMLDVTEQKRAEEAAAAAHCRLQDAVDSLPVGFRIFDKDERLVLINSSYEQDRFCHENLIKPGVTYEQLLRNIIFEGIAVHNMESDEAYLEKRLAQFRSPPEQPVELRKTDGSTVLSIYRKMSDGGTVMILLDITEQKRAEEAAELANQRLRDAVESMPAGFRIFDAEERLVMWNSTYAKQTRWHGGHIEPGITFEEILKKTVRVRGWMDQVQQDDNYIANRLAEFRNPASPYEVSRSDGRHFIHIYKRTTDGGTVSVMMEITQQKQAELRAERDRRRLIDSLDALPIGFRLYDQDDRLVYTNDQNINQHAWHSRFLKTGLTYEEILRTSVEAGAHLHDMESDDAYIRYRLEKFHKADGKRIERRRADGRTALMLFHKTRDGETASMVLDITEQKDAERRAFEIQQRLFDAIESLPAGFCLFDETERLVQVNSLQKAAAHWQIDLLEPETTYEEILRDGVAKGMYLHGFGNNDEFVAHHLNHFRSENPSPYEIHYVTGRHVLAYFRKTSTGGTVSVQLDVTERYEAECRAKDASQRLFDAIESLPVGFCLFNKDEQLVINNSYMRELTPWNEGTLRFGVTFEDLVRNAVENRVFRDVDFDDSAAVSEFVADRLERFRNPKQEPTEHNRIDGTSTLSAFHRTTDGGTVFVMMDITKRKHAERALKASEDRLNAILDLAPEAIVTTDLHNTIQMFNAGAERLFGYRAAEAAGRSIDCLFAQQEQVETDAFASDPGPNSVPWRNAGRREAIARHREGREFPVEISSAETIVDGQHLNTVLFQDISERKRWEDDLRNAMQLADAANRAKSEFLSHMSHELRTPLNGILGYAEFIKDKWLGDDALDKYVEYAGFITESGQHLLQLINDILDLSKVEAGQYEPVFAAIDFRELFEECDIMVATDAEKAGIEIHCDVQPGSAIWTADRRALKQVLINLLSNAIKFSTANSRVEVTSSRDETGRYCLAVTDFGIGMSEDEARRALEPFVQVGQPYVTHQKGTGLGLALVVRLVALHRGSVEIVSEPEQGTTVRVVLPPIPRADVADSRKRPLSA